jgi:hypothetical protein
MKSLYKSLRPYCINENTSIIFLLNNNFDKNFCRKFYNKLCVDLALSARTCFGVRFYDSLFYSLNSSLKDEDEN